MLAKSLIDQIGRLLNEGQLSHRKIAAKLGVGRGTVAAVASGRRGLYGREPLDEGPASLVPLTPAERCPHCGYRVHMPCLVCRSRDYRERQAAARIAAAIAELAAQKNESRRQGRKQRQDGVAYFLVIHCRPINPSLRSACTDRGR